VNFRNRLGSFDTFCNASLIKLWIKLSNSLKSGNFLTVPAVRVFQEIRYSSREFVGLMVILSQLRRERNSS
jgi:hypothetical protein